MTSFFQNRRIVITGATSGIGLALAQKLAAEGAHLVLTGRKSSQRTALKPIINNKTVHYCEVDHSKRGSEKQLLDVLDQIGWNTLDHLVLNAGVGYVGDVLEQTPATINAMIEVNLQGPLMMATSLFTRLQAAEGSVLFVGSTASKKITPHYATYTATKTGLSDVARNLRNEWKSRVRVQEVLAGPTRTEFHKKSGMENPPLQALYMKPEEVADGVIKALKSGKREIRYTLSTLLYFAIKRSLLGAS